MGFTGDQFPHLGIGRSLNNLHPSPLEHFPFRRHKRGRASGEAHQARSQALPGAAGDDGVGLEGKASDGGALHGEGAVVVAAVVHGRVPAAGEAPLERPIPHQPLEPLHQQIPASGSSSPSWTTKAADPVPVPVPETVGRSAAGL